MQLARFFPLRRRSTAVAVVVTALLAAAGVISVQAGAMSGVEPNAAGTNVVHPTTNRPVDEWKWVGTYNGVSGVQIAPQWILTSRHAAPGGDGTERFTNRFGSALIDRVVHRPDHRGPGYNDVALAHLATPITAPRYPRVADGYLGEQLAEQQQGHMLAAGWAGGKLHADWSTPTGVPSTFDQSLADNTGGDSGGGIFWYSPRTADGVLTALNAVDDGEISHASLQHRCKTQGTEGTCVNAPVDDARSWIDGIVGPGVVNWVPVAELATARLAAGPTVTDPDHTSTSLGFTIVPPDPGDSVISGYRVQLRPAGIDFVTTDPKVRIPNLPTSQPQTILLTATTSSGPGGATRMFVAAPIGKANVRVTPTPTGVTVDGTITDGSFADSYFVYIADANKRVIFSEQTKLTHNGATTFSRTYTSPEVRRSTPYEVIVQLSRIHSVGGLVITPFRTLDVPPPVESVTSTPVAGGVEVDWVPAADNKGATPPANFRLTRNGQPVTVPGTARSHTFTGLSIDPPEAQRIDIAAVNTGGADDGVRTTSSPILVPPAVPTDLRAFPRNGGLELAWSDTRPVEFDTTFRLKIRDTGRAMSTANTRVTIDGLTNGRVYTIDVTAENGTGSSAVTTITGVPGTNAVGVGPITVTPEANGDRLSWNRPAGLNGTVMYVIDRANGNQVQTSATSWLRPKPASGQAPEVVSVSVLQSSPLGFVASPPVAVGTPSPSPTSVVATRVSDTAVQVTWTKASTTPAKGYRVSAFGPNLSTVTVSKDSTSATIELPQQAGRLVTVSVAAVHDSGHSPAARAFTQLSARPSAVRNLAAQAQTNGGLRLDWDVPANDGGQSPLYRVTSPHWSGPKIVGATHVDLTGLPAEQLLSFTVTPINGQGDGPATTTYAELNGASAVQRASINARQGGVDLSWKRPRWDQPKAGTFIAQFGWAVWPDAGPPSRTTWCGNEFEEGCRYGLTEATSASINGLTPGNYVVGVRAVGNQWAAGAPTFTRITVR